MSASGREVAHRIFAAEYDDATHSYSESDEERAPNYVVTPTGARVNRLFFVGVLTEVEAVSEEVLRGRVADPTGVFVLYAGQYQPDEMAFLEDAEPPLFVAVTGKARTFSPDDSDRVFTSVRPESINAVDADTRDRWTVEAAEATLARVATARAAMDLGHSGEALTAALRAAGVADDLADGIPRAFAAYGTTEQYLVAVADLAVDALELVAGEAEEVPGLSVAPDDPGDGTVDPASLAAVEGAVVDIDASAPPSEATTAETEPVSSAPDEEVENTAPAPQTEPSSHSGGAVEDDADDDIGDFEPPDAASDTADDAAETGTAGEDDGIGDFDPGGTATADDAETATTTADDVESGATATAEDPAAAEEMPAEDVLDDEERERLEEEYGAFESGTEVPEPGEADIEPEAGPIEPEEMAGEPAGDAVDDIVDDSGAEDAMAEPEPDDAAEEAVADSEDEAAEESAAEAGEPDENVDVDEALMALMAELDDGDGADREALVAAVVDEHGFDPGAVEDAIQDALMAGKCYEPDDAHVKPI